MHRHRGKVTKGGNMNDFFESLGNKLLQEHHCLTPAIQLAKFVRDLSQSSYFMMM